MQDLDIDDLKKQGATVLQIKKMQDIYQKLKASKYTDMSIWCRNSQCRIYLDSGHISVNTSGVAHVISSQEFFRKKIYALINAPSDS